mgnify:CR=1 FL=1
MKVAVWRGMFVAFIVTILVGAIIFIIWQGIEMVHLGGIEKKEFFQFILFTVMLGTSIGSLPDLFAKIQKSIGATESLISLIQQETEIIDTSKPVNSQKFLNGEIELKNLNFSYPSRKEVKILSGLNLNIKSGEQVALVGSSGSGKSTIASLLLQFYKLDEGEIKAESASESDKLKNRKSKKKKGGDLVVSDEASETDDLEPIAIEENSSPEDMLAGFDLDTDDKKK